MKKRQYRVIPLLFVLLTPNASWAAFVTTNEVGMDVIYSQLPAFGGIPPTPIDIRFNPTVTIANASLLNISSLADLNTLFSLSPAASPVVNMFFVDTVSFCNLPDPTPTITGCATINGNDIVVESAIAGGASGDILNSHELGHNLGLPHSGECTPVNNLMDCMLMSDVLTISQVTNTILNSPLVQTDQQTQALYVEITPVLITPIPAAVWLFGSALGLLGWISRQNST